MKRFAQFLGTVLACWVVGCGSNPKVVTVVVPYTAVLHLDPFSPWNGAADCDLQGQPVIYLHPALRDEQIPWILTHERIHVEQMKNYAGCANFARRVKADSMFRLHVEAEAYCGVLESQRRAHQTSIGPTYASIVLQLSRDYYHKYERDSVIAALPCR